MPKDLAQALDSAPPELRRIERAGRITLVAVVAGAIVLTLPFGDGWLEAEDGLLLLLGGAYLAVFVYVGEAAERSARRAHVTGYFALQLVLAAAVFAVPASQDAFGMTWLILMPLVAHAAFLLRWPGVTVVCVLSLALVTAHGAAVAGPRLALNAGVGVGLSTAFVLLFANITRIELSARTRSERLRDELALAHRRLAEYSVQAAELAASRERNRLAREIHDSLGHCLTVVSVQLEAAEMVLTRDPDDARARMRRARELAREGLAEVRRSVASLRSSPLDGRPLAAAVEALAAGEGEVAVGFRVLGEARELPEAAELTLYRGAQEGLTNVRRHARARSVEVTLDYRRPEAVRLTVIDDGVGAPAEAGAGVLEAGGGFGLLGLRERVQARAGRLEVRSRPGDGFTLEVEVPG
ncbi:MAG TPA: sensor histidine kinase [Thermoanaerobaculia bacterium]|nr:sensor histidine kinase [Thermoanaerobaculia bacterium]